MDSLRGKSHFLLVPAPSQTQSHLRHPLTALLGSVGHVHVLRALASDRVPPSAPQLAAAAGLTPQGTRPVLDVLTRQRQVKAHGSGRTQLHELSAAHPLASSLAALFHDEQGRWDALMSSIRVVIDRQGAVGAAWLHCGVARGEDSPDSDVDIALVVRSQAVADQAREALMPLEDAQQVRLSLTPRQGRRMTGKGPRKAVDGGHDPARLLQARESHESARSLVTAATAYGDEITAKAGASSTSRTARVRRACCARSCATACRTSRTGSSASCWAARTRSTTVRAASRSRRPSACSRSLTTSPHGQKVMPGMGTFHGGPPGRLRAHAIQVARRTARNATRHRRERKPLSCLLLSPRPLRYDSGLTERWPPAA